MAGLWETPQRMGSRSSGISKMPDMIILTWPDNNIFQLLDLFREAYDDWGEAKGDR